MSDAPGDNLADDLAELIRRVERLEAQTPPPAPDRFTRVFVWDQASVGSAPE